VMRGMRSIFILLLLLTASAASADITIRNFNGYDQTIIGNVQQYDDQNNIVDAHVPIITQVGGTYYRYGDSYNCGYQWRNAASTFCGFNVYTSTDMGYNKKWHLEGKLFDASQSTIQNNCQQSTGAGCFIVRVIFNPSNSTYVFWFTQPGASFSGGAEVFTCTTPTCGATPSTPGTVTWYPQPTGLAHGPPSSSLALFADGSGCYVFYNDFGSPRHNWIDKLNSTCTDSTGVTVDTNVTGEGSAIFERSGTFYAMVGNALCGYCSAGAATVYSTASAIMGPYSSSNTLTSTSCSAQISSVSTITAGGITSYIYNGDLWLGTANESFASGYWKPLAFSSPPAIDTLTCDDTVTIPGITPDPTSSPAVPSNADQTSVAVGYSSPCDISSAVYRMQTFVPTNSAISTIYMPIGQGNRYGAMGGGTNDGTLTVSLVTVDGSNNPTSVLSSHTYTLSDLTWSGDWTAVPLAATVTPGTTYGVVLSSSSSVNTCWGVSLYFGTFLPDPYTAGVERYSTSGGSITSATWTTETNRSLMFSTVPPVFGRSPRRL
jgi:hypothetical protein